MVTGGHSDDEWDKFMRSLEELVSEEDGWTELDEHEKLVDARLRNLMFLLLAVLSILAVACTIAAMAR
jgi:hypothetical protein